MRFSKFALVLGTIFAALPGITVFADAAPTATTPSAVNPARRAARQAEVKTIRTDIRAIRTAHKSRDKAGVQAGLAQLKTDWQGLPPKLQQRIQQKHPAIFKKLRDHLSKPARHKKAAAQ